MFKFNVDFIILNCFEPIIASNIMVI